MLVGIRGRILHYLRLSPAGILHRHPILLHPMHDPSADRGVLHVDVLLLQQRPRQVPPAPPQQRCQSNARGLFRFHSRLHIRRQR